MSRSKQNKQSRRSKTRNPSIQALEDRKLMAADWGISIGSAIPSISIEDNVVEIDGSFLADQVSVKILENGTPDPNDDAIQIKASNALGERTRTLDRMDANGQPLVDRIVFRGYDGNDTFENFSDRPARAYGGSGHDNLRGGTAADRLYGQGGNDWLYGLEGIDRLFGGSGNDYLFGHAGDDVMRGESGNDTLFGNTGDDEISGGAGNDRLYGSSGDDELRGDQGDDYVSGSTGKDLILGGSGHDRLYGGAGNDTIMGESGRDDLYGGSGRDILHGGKNVDFLYGGSQDDMLIGGNGRDYLYGNDGDDVLFGGKVSINPYAPGYDEVYVGGDTEDDEHDFLTGGTGSDRFYLGDHGFFDIGTDHVKDATVEDIVIDLDPFGVDFSEVGIHPWDTYGHQS